MDPSTWGKIWLSYSLSLLIIIVPSITCSTIHIYKFFRSPSPQSLANKNITLYCFFLIASNLFFAEEYFMILDRSVRLYTLVYFLSLTTIFKFIIALDLCLYFRKVALYLQQPSGPHNTKFCIYCFLGTGIPLLEAIITPTVEQDFRVLGYSAFIRIARLIPIFGAFWYIRSASIDKKEFRSNFSLHMRLLILIGGVSSVYSIVEVIVITQIAININPLLIYSGSVMLNNLGVAIEAILIGILFTFKQGTFKPVTI